MNEKENFGPQVVINLNLEMSLNSPINLETFKEMEALLASLHEAKGLQLKCNHVRACPGNPHAN